jgi:hypothetical protein
MIADRPQKQSPGVGGGGQGGHGGMDGMDGMDFENARRLDRARGE